MLLRDNIFFLHIPKTGGMSILRAFDIELYPVHGYVSDFKKETKEWDRLFKFSVVRNPFDRMVSYYLWRKSHNHGIEAHHREFVDWLREIPNFRTGMHKDDYLDVGSYLRVGVQQQFDLLSENGKIQVDKVIRFENLNNEIKAIDANVMLQHFHKQKRDEYQKYYDEDSRKLIEQLFEKDLEFFNYTF